MSKEEGETLQVWTESPCLHKKILKPLKEPKPYKSEPVLTDDDFKELGIDNNGRSEFYRQYGKEINNSNMAVGRRRKIALDLLKKWILNQ